MYIAYYNGGAVVRAPGAALAARLSCGARSLGIERSWWRREWSERVVITLVTGYNVKYVRCAVSWGEAVCP